MNSFSCVGRRSPLHINFDYEGCNLRCCYCFSYRHLPTKCHQPRPGLFSTPDIIYDPVANDLPGVAPEGNRGNSGPQVVRSNLQPAREAVLHGGQGGLNMNGWIVMRVGM